MQAAGFATALLVCRGPVRQFSSRDNIQYTSKQPQQLTSSSPLLLPGSFRTKTKPGAALVDPVL